MAETFKQDDLINHAKSSGWELVSGQDQTPVTGTLEDVARAAHERHKAGHGVGLIRRIEDAVELEMLQIETLWQQLGLPR